MYLNNYYLKGRDWVYVPPTESVRGRHWKITLKIGDVIRELNQSGVVIKKLYNDGGAIGKLNSSGDVLEQYDT